MKRIVGAMATSIVVLAVFGAFGWRPGGEAVEFKQAELRVEINSTDGDAGLQIDLDHEPWSSIRLRSPDGSVLVDVRNRGVLADYGLTELFSESSEPPFDEFPLAEFKRLFPEGRYVFEGRQIDGGRMRSTFELTHDFPAGPLILAPADADEITDDLVVEWSPVTEPAGIEIVRYQVLVSFEGDAALGVDLEVPPDTTSVTIPRDFVDEPGEYKIEVLAVEAGGNQTLSEITVTIS